MKRFALASMTIMALGCAEAEPQAPINTSNATTSAATVEPARLLEWDELMPEGEDERLTKIYEDYYNDLQSRFQSQGSMMLGDFGGITEGSSLDTMPQLGTFNTVDELDGQLIELPGFVVPLDTAKGKISTFLIVPYFGACIHTPPPAPNQIVYAIADPAVRIDGLYYPYWFRGILRTERQDTGLGNAAYTLEFESLRDYE